MAQILLVEDEPNVALGLKNELAEEGYKVEVVGDGEAAMERVQLGSIDLILLDVNLPKKDGYAVCRDLRQIGNRTPILMLTARDSEAERALGLSLGADDYVVKPFSSLELLARVQALLRRTTGDDHRMHRFGDIEVDFDRAEIRRNNRPVEVTALEFKLLKLFIQERGRILTRDQLLDDIWRAESSPTDRAIDNHVMNLRRKIEADPQHPKYVVSVRGLGYRFEG